MKLFRKPDLTKNYFLLKIGFRMGFIYWPNGQLTNFCPITGKRNYPSPATQSTVSETVRSFFLKTFSQTSVFFSPNLHSESSRKQIASLEERKENQSTESNLMIYVICKQHFSKLQYKLLIRFSNHWSRGEEGTPGSEARCRTSPIQPSRIQTFTFFYQLALCNFFHKVAVII